MKDSIFLSVIIPAFNEEPNFKAGKLDQVNNYLSSQNYSWEAIVIDDGSSDQTADLVQDWIKSKPNWKLIKNKHYGKSKAVATGMLRASGELRLFTDFDQATPLSEVTKVISKYQSGYQVIIGSRELKGASREKEPVIRHIMGRVFNLLVQIIAVRSITDTQCGFKAFSGQATQDLFNRLVIYKNHKSADAYTGAFDVELIFLARKFGYKITQIPVSWKYVDTSRVNPIKDSVRMLLDIFKIRLAYISGKYSNQ